MLVRLLDGKHALFYRLMMSGMNGLGIALCVGTGHVMQRSALDSVGGFAINTAVEDVRSLRLWIHLIIK